MDAFYAAVEQRDRPELRGLPVIVGGDPNGRGVVATCSYEARKFGIHSAMPAAHAVRLCPDAIFVRPRFEAYKDASRQIQAVFARYTDLIEPLSLDEAYLDVTDCEVMHGSATLIAKQIKQAIWDETRLVASAGVSYNKFLAKQASDLEKPDGLTLITPEQGPDFVAKLMIGKFHGIGKATEARMNALGIESGADLRNWPLERLQQVFGKSASYYYQVSRGDDPRAVVSERVRKSIGAENTFAKDLENPEDMLLRLKPLAQEVGQSLRVRGFAACTVTLKVKYDDFQQITRSVTPDAPVRSPAEIESLLPQLLNKTEAGERKVRLLGVTASNLTAASSLSRVPVQLKLFGA